MIVGGVVVETALEKIVDGVRAQGKVAKRPINEGRAGGGGVGIGGVPPGLGGFRGPADLVWSGR